MLLSLRAIRPQKIMIVAGSSADLAKITTKSPKITANVCPLAVNNGWKVPIFEFKSRNNRLEPKFEIFFATITRLLEI